MRIGFILEKNIMAEACFGRIVDWLEKKSLPFAVIEVIPFSHEIVGGAPKPDGAELIIFLGSIGGQKVAEREGWKVWNRDFSMESCNKIRPWLLNADNQVLKLSEIGSVDLDTFFIRPVSDNKEFAGTVLKRDDAQKWVDNMLSIGYLETDDFDVVVSSPKIMDREFRCIVIDGQVVAGSMYRTKYIKTQKPLSNDLKVIFQKMVDKISKIYAPDDVYAIDFAETVDGWKVVEYNCFNSAGLYESDIPSIMTALVQKTNQ